MQIKFDEQKATEMKCLLSTGLFCLALSASQPGVADETNSRVRSDDEGPPSKERIALEPRLYWYYDVLGKLDNITNIDGRIEGAYYERMKPTYFTLDRAKLEDTVGRAEGYRSAIAKIISYMAPGAIPDIAENRKYMAELLAKLKAISGQELDGYEAWNRWFVKNKNKLKWSKEKKQLVAESQ